MATSGTYLFNPNLNEIFDEVVEMAGIDPAVTGSSHIKSFSRSCRLMLNSEWATIGITNWSVTEEIHTLAVGETQFPLPAGGIDIVEAVLRRYGDSTPNAQYSDVEMYAITRNEYLTIVDKQNQGRPDRYWVNRQVSPVVNYWQAGSNTSDQMVYNMFRQNQDVSGALADNLGLPAIAYDAFVTGLAAKMALKWNPQKFQLLNTLYLGQNQNQENPGGKLGALRNEDRERGDIDLYAAFEPRTGRR